MVRFFGFLLAVAVMVSGANAALLVKFDFTNGTESTTGGGSAPYTNNKESNAEELDSQLTSPATFVAVSGTVNQPNGINPLTGLFTSRVALSSSVNVGAFTLNLIDSLNVPGGGRVDFTGVKVKFRSSTTAGVTAVSYELEYDGQIVATRSSSTPGFFDDTLVSFTKSYSFDVNDGSGMSFSLNGGRTGAAANARLVVDYIELYGTIVPEPASMAIFGLMGAGFAVRRIRRKA